MIFPYSFTANNLMLYAVNAAYPIIVARKTPVGERSISAIFLIFFEKTSKKRKGVGQTKKKSWRRDP